MKLRQTILSVGLKWLACLFVVCGVSEADAQQKQSFKPDETGHRRTAVPFLRKHCLKCHGPRKAEGEFRIDDQLKNDFEDLATKQKWGEVVNVLNSHEMPPEAEKQPSTKEVAKIVDWITGEMARMELYRRDSAIVLRRLNRNEYQNTIRDLVGIDFNPDRFPEDPPAGGFDNNGGALTVSPLHLELYYESAREILDRALVNGPKPDKTIKWRFEPETGDSDSHRVKYDGQNLIVRHGKDRVEKNFTVMHHDSWDRTINVRSFVVPSEGTYIIRVRAGGTVPSRNQVVASARNFIEQRAQKDIQKKPRSASAVKRRTEETVKNFQKSPIYKYGSPRFRLILKLGGQPTVLTEQDVDADVKNPQIFEISTRLTTKKAGLTIRYAYDIPRELENFWFQTGDEFPRPELWIDWMELEGPINETWPPKSHKKILFRSSSSLRDKGGYAKEVIARFMQRAWRRPVTEAEVAEKMALYEDAVKSNQSFVEAIKSPLIAVLISPNFLYLVEPSDANVSRTSTHKSRELNDYELANRLSYFLWSSMPDDNLFQLAESGQLKDNAILSSEVDRMLNDPKAAAFTKNFAGQWLGLREVGANPPARDLYPRYDRHLETSIVKESEAFFAEILNNDLSAMNFVKSNFVTINERLARFYNIPGVKGDEFRKVRIPRNVPRGGIVTQASVLTITSNGTRTSPVKRGTWILKNLLGTDPGLPVANVGEIAPKVPGIDKATVRQRLEIHRSLPQCARCHSKIDPLGFSLENFNAAGDWRDKEGFGYKGRIGPNDPDIDASSKLPDGTEINGVKSLQLALMKKKNLFLNCLAGKMMTYALGRELGIADQIEVKAAVKHMSRNKETLRSLVKYITTSSSFQTK